MRTLAHLAVFGLALAVHPHAGNAQTVDPALASVSWRVLEIEGERAPFPSTLQFGAHAISGRGPCNRFSAGVKQTGAVLDIGQPVPTRATCQGRMDAETRYFDTLHAVKGYALADGALTLTAADGRVLLKLGK